MTKTIRLTIDVDVSIFSDSVIEKTVQDLKEDFLPSITGAFKSAEVSLPATGYLEVVTKYE